MALRIIEALDAYLRALDSGTVGEVGAAVNQLRRARSQMTFATPEQLQKALECYCVGSDDDVEVGDGAITAPGDGGTWVNVWVWLAEEPGNE